MEIRKLISKFLTSLVEKNYSKANNDLKQVVEAKLTEKIKKTAVKQKEEKGKKKLSPAQKKIASAAPPFNKITGADFKSLKNKKNSKKGNK
jgi:hypothetical protein